MKIQRMIRVLESVLQEKGNVEVVILDNDSDSLIDVTQIGMAEDGRLAIYGSWHSPAEYGRIVEMLWEEDGKPDQVKPERTNLDDLVWGQVTGGEITSVLFIDDGDVPPMMEGTAEVVTAGRGVVEFDAEGRIVRVEWDEEE